MSLEGCRRVGKAHRSGETGWKARDGSDEVACYPHAILLCLICPLLLGGQVFFINEAVFHSHAISLSSFPPTHSPRFLGGSFFLNEVACYPHTVSFFYHAHLPPPLLGFFFSPWQGGVPPNHHLVLLLSPPYCWGGSFFFDKAVCYLHSLIQFVFHFYYRYNLC